MFLPITFNTSIQLNPSELQINFEDTINKKLKLEYEGICSKYGFIKPNSIKIQKRSIGIFSKQHFNGNIQFDLQCNADVCNPIKGLVVEAIIKNKNALGLLAESSIEIDSKQVPVLDIIIPKKAAGIMSEIDLDSININDSIYVMVLSKRYQMNDNKIAIIGKAVKSLDSTIDELAENKIDELNIENIEEHESEEEISIEDDESSSEKSDDDSSELSEKINIKPIKIMGDDEQETSEVEDLEEVDIDDEYSEDEDDLEGVGIDDE